MNKYVKWAIYIGIVYFAYSYYVSNYTESGKANKLLEEEAKRAEAEAERIADRERAMEGCRRIYDSPTMSEGQKWNEYQICESNVNASYGIK